MREKLGRAAMVLMFSMTTLAFSSGLKAEEMADDAQMTPPRAVVSTPSPFQEEASSFKPTKELEINWNALIGEAIYSENDQEQSLSTGGIMLEVNPGLNITTAPGLDMGMVVGFILSSASDTFNIIYDGPPEYTRNWDVSALSLGSYVLAKYSYDIDLNFIKIGLENGYGLGYFINSVTTDWKDAEDSSINGSDTSDEKNWAPVIKGGLKIDVPTTAVSSVGLNLGVNFIPLTIGDYVNLLSYSIGLNYQVKY
jgi:hypothetical protein